MANTIEFNFNNDSIAKAYDSVLVPSLFYPWALQLIEDCKPLQGKQVLELACGTGVVTKELIKNVESFGQIFALDINNQMLEIARGKCKESKSITFIQGAADSLPVQRNSIDLVVCQQGFQFFPNKKTCAVQIYEVLKPKGSVYITTWCSVDECELFGAICTSLETIGEKEISELMRIPFDNFNPKELFDSFKPAGFSKIQVTKEIKLLKLKGGIDNVINFAYATPIGPKLKSLEPELQEQFQEILIKKSIKLLDSHGHIGKMATNKLIAIK